jgi:hypothetical protein
MTTVITYHTAKQSAMTTVITYHAVKQSPMIQLLPTIQLNSQL